MLLALQSLLHREKVVVEVLQSPPLSRELLIVVIKLDCFFFLLVAGFLVEIVQRGVQFAVGKVFQHFSASSLFFVLFF